MGPERKIEAAACAYAKRRGCWALKLGGLTGLPDRLILGPRRLVIFVEFKAPAGRLSARQRTVIAGLKLFGFVVFVIDDKNNFIDMLDKALKKP